MTKGEYLKMKRKLSLLLALVLALALFMTACGGSKDTATNEPEETEQPTETGEGDEETLEPPAEPMGQLIIGNTTEMSGEWLPYFQNIASDYDIWNFINGYSTVAITFDGEYVVDTTVVKDYKVTENEDGSKTYTWTIVDNLVYDDGTPITAKDYVASALLWSSQLLGEMGGSNSYGLYWKGWSEFSKGQTNVFAGVNLIDDYTFAVTIDASNLPYFYELPMVSVGPTKLSYWLDETVDIADDGEGCYFTVDINAKNPDGSLVYAEKISAAKSNPFYPASGPYVVKSFDATTKTAVLEVNDKYVGDYTGQKPKIKTIIYKLVNQSTQFDELATGSVDLLPENGSGDDINAGLDLVEQGGFSYSTHPRSGYGKIHFACDFGPTADVEVRQAIAHLLDRNEFAKSFTGGFGSVVNGPYGEAMWFYQETKAELNQKVNQYPYDLNKAIELLESAGWTLNANGEPYKEGDGVRYKRTEDGKLMPLIIEWASTENNQVSDLLVVKLQQNPDLAKAGIQINQTTMTFPELINWMYRDKSQGAEYAVPTYHMFNLATNYTPWYDLSTEYVTDPDMVAAGYNTNYIFDEELERLSKEMVLVDPNDREGFKRKFVDFIVRWNYLLPDLPLYSNIYHDFYNDKLQNWKMNSNVDVTQAVLYAWVTE